MEGSKHRANNNGFLKDKYSKAISLSLSLLSYNILRKFTHREQDGRTKNHDAIHKSTTREGGKRKVFSTLQEKKRVHMRKPDPSAKTSNIFQHLKQ